MQVNSFAPSGGWPGRQILKRIWVAKPFDLPPEPFNLQFRLSELGCVDLCPKLGQGVRIGTNSRLGGEK